MRANEPTLAETLRSVVGSDSRLTLVEHDGSLFKDLEDGWQEVRIRYPMRASVGTIVVLYKYGKHKKADFIHNVRSAMQVAAENMASGKTWDEYLGL